MKEAENKWDAYGRSRSPWRQRTLFLHHQLAQKRIASLLGKIDRKTRVLDAGCGDGFFLNLLLQMGFKNIRGIDAGRSMVERCRERGLPAEQKSLEEFTDAGGFDLILLIEVLEHLRDPGAAIEKIKSLLRPGGKLLLTVPVCDSLRKRYHRFRYGVTKLEQVVDWDETHLHAFSAREIKQLLASRGLTVDRCLHASNPYPWIRRYGGDRLSASFQRFDLGGRFGDILIVLASRK